MLTRGFQQYLIADLKLVFREPIVLFFQFALPVGMYGLFGFIFGHAPNRTAGFDYYNDYTSNFLAVTLLNVALMGLSASFVIYKEFGFLKQLIITPMDTSAIWMAAILKGLTVFLIGFGEIVIVGWLMFDKWPHNLLQIVVALLFSAYCLFSLGFMLGAIFKTANTAYAANGVLFQMMLLLSGASIPLAQMPGGLQNASLVLPMTHVVEILRLGWHGELFQQASVTPVLITIAMGTVFAVVARATFRRSFA
jgi:ABC-2 type transport system permease protein